MPFLPFSCVSHFRRLINSANSDIMAIKSHFAIKTSKAIVAHKVSIAIKVITFKSANTAIASALFYRLVF